MSSSNMHTAVENYLRRTTQFILCIVDVCTQHDQYMLSSLTHTRPVRSDTYPIDTRSVPCIYIGCVCACVSASVRYALNKQGIRRTSSVHDRSVTMVEIDDRYVL
jgi:hypothetical protein